MSEGLRWNDVKEGVGGERKGDVEVGEGGRKRKVNAEVGEGRGGSRSWRRSCERRRERKECRRKKK